MTRLPSLIEGRRSRRLERPADGADRRVRRSRAVRRRLRPRHLPVLGSVRPRRVVPPAAIRSDQARVAFGVSTASGRFTKLEHDGRYVDVESIDARLLVNAHNALAADAAPVGWAVKLAAGLRDAIAVHGSDQLRAWQRRLAYCDQTAIAEVTTRAGRLLPPAALFGLTHAGATP